MIIASPASTTTTTVAVTASARLGAGEDQFFAVPLSALMPLIPFPLLNVSP